MFSDGWIRDPCLIYGMMHGFICLDGWMDGVILSICTCLSVCLAGCLGW